MKKVKEDVDNKLFVTGCSYIYDNEMLHSNLHFKGFHNPVPKGERMFYGTSCLGLLQSRWQRCPTKRKKERGPCPCEFEPSSIGAVLQIPNADHTLCW